LFFSEEKNQKTFASSAGCTIRALAGILETGFTGFRILQPRLCTALQHSLLRRRLAMKRRGVSA
jgi:predicted aspartyl protease